MQQNKYENFIDSLVQKTAKRSISWGLTGRRVPFTTLNEDLINKSFECENFREGSIIYVVRFLDPRMTTSGGEEFDRYFVRVFVLKDNEVLREISSDEVDEELLIELFQAVDSNNSDDDEYFKDFE